MKPSSLHSDGPYAGLLGPLWGDSEVDGRLSDGALVAAMLRVEGVLASAQGAVGLIPQESALVIAAVAGAAAYDPAELGAAAVGPGNPVVPLAARLTRDVRDRSPAAASHVHFGATSQDILDTALMLVYRECVALVLGQIQNAAASVAALAQEHARTVMPGRTLGQIAAPTTFGLKAVGWLSGLDAASERLGQVSTRLAVQLGGAVGTRAAWGPKADELTGAIAADLGLAAAVPWHTERSRVVELAAALGQVVAAVGTIAADIIVLSQNEIGEVAEGAEPGRGSSSAMPHKQNPIGSVLVRSAALRAPGLVSSLFTAAVQDSERATGPWHAEWEPLRDLLHLAGGATATAAHVLSRLTINAEAMQRNLTGPGSAIFAESVSRALMAALDRAQAQDLVAEAARESTRTATPFQDVLAADPRVRAHLSSADLDAAFDPRAHQACAARIVERVLATRDLAQSR